MSAFSSFVRRSLALALASIILIAPGKARGVDVLYYAISKDEGFNQTSAGSAAPKGNPYRFDANVGLATANSVTNATVQFLPSGPVYPLVAGPYSFDFQAKFLNLAALDAAVPNGNYQLVINTVHDGTHTITFPLNGDAYPATTPVISNFTQAQTINPSAAFTFTWGAFSGGTTTDFVQLLIADASGVTLFQTPDPGQAGALDGTAILAVIPANTLPASAPLGGQLLFARPVAVDATTYPGVSGFASYYKFTQFNFATTAGTNFPPPRLVASSPNNPGQFQLQLIGQAGLRYAIEASTSLHPGSWSSLVTNTAVGGNFIFTDSQSATFPSRFYRGRTAN
jgi:hypothetical protein